MLCAQSLAGPFIEPGCVIMDGCRGIGFLYLPPTFPLPNLNFALDNFRLDMTYDLIVNLRKRYSDFKRNRQQQQTTNSELRRRVNLSQHSYTSRGSFLPQVLCYLEVYNKSYAHTLLLTQTGVQALELSCIQDLLK